MFLTPMNAAALLLLWPAYVKKRKIPQTKKKSIKIPGRINVTPPIYNKNEVIVTLKQ